MKLDINRNQLAPIAGNVRADLVSYDRNNPAHASLLREAAPQFLGSLAAKHGATFSTNNVNPIISAANAKEIEITFVYVALETCDPVQLAGLATGAPTFGVEWDKNNQMQIVPVYHGEDLFIDAGIAKKFRELTRSKQHPNGIGLGSWVMGEQVRRSLSDPDWVFGGRDNEHAPDNQAIIGVMNKYGAIHGIEQDSAVLQFDRLTDNIKNRWGVSIAPEALPADPLGLRPCPNNFMTRWSSEDGQQQIAVIYRKLPPTSDNETAVWTKIKSNGNLPQDEMLKEVLASLLTAGAKEIASPERRWGVPKEMIGAENDLSHIFGGPVPVMHLHTVQEKPIIDALLGMGAIHRRYGNANMVSGIINPRSLPNPEAVFGQKLPDATVVSGIKTEPAANEPIFGFGPMSQPQRLQLPNSTKRNIRNQLVA